MWIWDYKNTAAINVALIKFLNIEPYSVGNGEGTRYRIMAYINDSAFTIRNGFANEASAGEYLTKLLGGKTSNNVQI